LGRKLEKAGHSVCSLDAGGFQGLYRAVQQGRLESMSAVFLDDRDNRVKTNGISSLHFDLFKKPSSGDSISTLTVSVSISRSASPFFTF
jgi:hypothetical protein